MIERLNRLDTELFLWLNGRHNAFFDPIMYWASHKLFWIPFYGFLLYIIIREYKKRSVYILAAIALLITLCDQTASGLLKQLVKRPRPSHEAALDGLIHLSKAGPGGQYGFVSSHAANAFGLAVFLMLLFPKRYNALKFILGLWALLVAYSRIYVGVHYPGDVVVAALIGSAIAWFVHWGYCRLLG